MDAYHFILKTPAMVPQQFPADMSIRIRTERTAVYYSIHWWHLLAPFCILHWIS